MDPLAAGGTVDRNGTAPLLTNAAARPDADWRQCGPPVESPEESGLLFFCSL